MDTHNLKAFLSVAESGSFTLAAEQLHLTQPAVSKRVALLEQQLNCRLFDRIGRSITLTEAGTALLGRARQVLQLVADTELTLSNLSGDVGGTLRLATSHHIGLHHLPQILRDFTRAYPQVELRLEFVDSDHAFAAIDSGSAELGLLTLPSRLPDNITSQSILDDPLAFVVATDHPLAQRDDISLEHLSPYPAILPDANTYTSQLVSNLFAEHHQQLQISMATNYLETIKMMISIGLGWSVLPLTIIDGLHSLPLETHPLTRQLGYIHHRQRTLSNAARAFIEALHEHAGRAD